MVLVRLAGDDDVDAIRAIHNEAIRASRALWTDTPATRTDRVEWLAERHLAGHAVLVAEVDDVVVGYASYAPWRSRIGYRFSVEDSIYLHHEHRGRGIGAVLLSELISRARIAGMHVMIADIEAGNAVSITLHERLGFTRVGLVKQVGTKFGEWLDLAILQRFLSDGPPAAGAGAP